MAGKQKSGHDRGETLCGNSVFRWGSRTYIMGIVNLSPDSFSGDGLRDAKDALAQAEKMVEEGADIIDVGGESTRPGAGAVSAEEETARVVPFIKLAAKRLSVPISVDTYKMEVAQRAVDAGACMINDISGLRVEPDLVKLAAEKKVPVVLTSNERGNPVANIMESVLGNLRRLIEIAEKAGVHRHNIIVDPGIGFGKTVDQNLEIMRRLDELDVLERPILLGASRKSFIGAVLGADVRDRLEGGATTVAIGISKGADMVRVHDVRQMVLVCRMSDAIARGVL
jgi:dihydropteroate synthase